MGHPEEAFTDLLSSVDNTTAIGLRDQIVLRLGLSGVRAQEIARMTVGDVQLHTTPPVLHWTGKGYKPRHITLGRPTVAIIPPLPRRLRRRHRPPRSPNAPSSAAAYPAAPPKAAHPPGLRHRPGGARCLHPEVVYKAARNSGLGHVSPNGLHSGTAGILHGEKSADGAHRFDLLDIQNVLGHAYPATTMRCYLEPHGHRRPRPGRQPPRLTGPPPGTCHSAQKIGSTR